MHTLVLQPSRLLAQLRWLAAGVTGALVLWLLANGMPFAAAPALLAVLWAWRARQPALRLRLGADGRLGVSALDGTGKEELSVHAAFAGPGWLVLRLGGGMRRVLVLAPDAASAEELRQLRVWLRLVAPRPALNSRRAGVS